MIPIPATDHFAALVSLASVAVRKIRSLPSKKLKTKIETRPSDVFLHTLITTGSREGERVR